MKKFLSLLLAVALFCIFTFAHAESEDMRAFYNPNEYTLLKVVDAFHMDDGDYVVQGCFGDAAPLEDWQDESDGSWVGFDNEQVFTLVLDKDAVIEIPASLDTIEDNVPATHEDLMAFVNQMREELNNVDFYCEFEMNEDGVLTKLVYCFFPY